jgi:hypothetical protein
VAAMRTGGLIVCVGFALCGASALAFAQEKPGPARPIPELDQLKSLEGNWRCDGKVPAGPMGPEHTYKATFKVKKDLDGYWYVAEYEQRKSKDNPAPIRAHAYFGYDGGTKKYVLNAFDNLGGLMAETSPGWDGERLVATGDGTAMGQKVAFRETFTKKSERELTWLGEMKMGKDWMVVGNDTCKK